LLRDYWIPSSQNLNHSKLSFEIFSDVQADPPVHVIEQAVEAAQRYKSDYIVGFGGGSSMDVAKLVALLAWGKERLEDIYGIDKVSGHAIAIDFGPHYCWHWFRRLPKALWLP
jgi:alcohol dehydrogenase class IV